MLKFYSCFVQFCCGISTSKTAKHEHRAKNDKILEFFENCCIKEAKNNTRTKR